MSDIEARETSPRDTCGLIMAYRLKLKKPLEDCARRILVEQCDQAIEALTRKSGTVLDPTAAIHGTRKALKRMRALLRLVRSGLGNERWKEENVALRDIARRLSALRDDDVNRQTIAKLSVDAPRTLAQALERLGKTLTSPDAEPVDRPALLSEVRKEICDCRDRFDALEIDGSDKDIVAEGLAAGHRRGRTALDRIEDDADDEAIHDLRKAVQAHWRQMSLMMRAWPELIKARVGEARDLSQKLGEMNDLALLVLLTRTAQEQGLSNADAGRIIAACEAQRVPLAADAIARSRRLFSAKPKAFAADLIGCLEAAEALAKLQPREADTVPSK